MNLLFDLDGTLTDPFLGITKCISYALEKMGMQSPPLESLGWCIGPPLKSSLAKLLASDDDTLVDKAIALYRERYGTVGLFENKVYEGIPEVLESLRENGHMLFVATSKPTIYAVQIIEYFILNKYFNGIYGSDLDGTRSNKKSLISHILRNESLASANTVMIGDRKHDIIGANANGISGIGVLWGYGTKGELEASGAHCLVENPVELIDEFN